MPENKRYHEINLIDLSCNTILLVAQVELGILSGFVSLASLSVYLVTDYLKYLGRFLSFPLKQLTKRENYYGFIKYEFVFGTVAGLVSLAAGIFLMVYSFKNLDYTPELGNLYPSIGITAIFVILRYSQRKKSLQGERISSINSQSVIDTGMILAFFVLAGQLLTQFTGTDIPDPLLAVVIFFFIFRSSFRLSWDSLRQLLDTRLPLQVEENIRMLVERSIDRNLQLDGLFARRQGRDRLIDLRLSYRRVSTEQAYLFANQLEKQILSKISRAIVVIHLDSVDTG